MKHHIEGLLSHALQGLQATGLLPPDHAVTITVDHTKSKEHGDFASNIALVLAKIAHAPPRALAEKIVKALPASNKVSKVEIAGPGFINFSLNPDAHLDAVREIRRDANIHHNDTRPRLTSQHIDCRAALEKI